MQLQHVDNYTPFEWFAFEKMALGKKMQDVLIVKAVCQLVLNGDCYNFAPAPEGEIAPIHMSDEPYDFDGGPYASLHAVGDAVLYKPATDFFLTGSAVPPDGNTGSWGAEICLKSHGKEYKQTIVLHGERHWQYSLLNGWHLSKPKPCDRIGLRYELAYGGSHPVKDTWDRFPHNPVGRGHFPVHRMDKEVYYPAARIELLKDQLKKIDKPIAVPALGPIPRTWPCRTRYAGTYDDQWRANARQHPEDVDYPIDFDTHFFQAAHPDWVFEPYWKGNETVQLAGFTSNNFIDCKLPGWQIILNGQGSRGALKPQPMRLDTVELNLDRMRLYLVWRMLIDQDLQIESARVNLQEEGKSNAVASKK